MGAGIEPTELVGLGPMYGSTAAVAPKTEPSATYDGGDFQKSFDAMVSQRDSWKAMAHDAASFNRMVNSFNGMVDLFNRMVAERNRMVAERNRWRRRYEEASANVFALNSMAFNFPAVDLPDPPRRPDGTLAPKPEPWTPPVDGGDRRRIGG